MDDESELEMVHRHVAEGERHVARQRLLIEELRRDKHDTEIAATLLTTFEAILMQHRAHLERLLAIGRPPA